MSKESAEEASQNYNSAKNAKSGINFDCKDSKLGFVDDEVEDVDTNTLILDVGVANLATVRVLTDITVNDCTQSQSSCASKVLGDEVDT